MPHWLNNWFVWCNNTKPFFFRTLFDYRNLMFWFPLLCSALRKKIMRYGSDEIVISSFAAVKNVISIKRPVSLEIKSPATSIDKTKNNDIRRPVSHLYLHSPMQYIRENYEENYNKLSFPIKQFYRLATQYLRPWDRATRHYDRVEANSHYTAALAKKLYSIDAQVRYPQLNSAFFAQTPVGAPKNYFVFVGRVQRYVREIDKIIALFNATGEHLLIIGDGPDMAYAQSIAGPTITFLGQITDVAQKIEIMRHARGCINLAKESFGLVTAESLCLGVPVFGYAGGATPELVTDGLDGVLVQEKDAVGLAAGWKRFVQMDVVKGEIAARIREKL